MARVEIPVSNLPGPFSLTGQEMTLTAINTTDGNYVTGANVLLIVTNRDAGAQTITIKSQPEQSTGRVGDVNAQSLAANEQRVFQLQANGWADTSNQILIDGSSTNIFCGVIQPT